MSADELPMAVRVFLGSWFYRDESKPELNAAESEFIVAALGANPERWQASPDVTRMKSILQSNPEVLDDIGPRLLAISIGMNGTAPTIRLLLEEHVPFEMDQTVYNTIHEGAWAGAADSLEALFESGVADATGISVLKPHTGWPDNISLMYWAAHIGFPEVARVLIKYGVGIHHELQIKGNGERGTTSLQEALAPSPWDAEHERTSARLAVAELLLTDGAFYDVYSAAARNDVARINQLLEENSEIAKTVDPFGVTPLHWACRAGSAECVLLLLDKGADPNAQNKNNRTPAMMAADTDQAQAIHTLDQAGADLNMQDKKGRTALHRAMYEGKPNAAEMLIDCGADPMLLNKNGKNAFQVARKDAKHFKQFA